MRFESSGRTAAATFLRRTSLPIGALLFVAGCSRQRPTPSDTARASAAPSTSAASSAPTATSHPGLTEPAVRELVRNWAAAQSANDFAGYDSLYAERFTGVKRAGSFTARLGRKAWMADRKTMILPGLVVEASDVRIDVTPDAATVHLVQHYKSPHFEDVGPKQLVVISTPDGPRIAREEMLSSSIQMQGMGRPLAGRLHAADSTGVFLVPGLPENASKGPKTVRRPEYMQVFEVDSAVEASALTAEQRAFAGRTFTAYDASGKPCKAVVQDLAMRAMVTPHFGTVQLFDDKEQYPDRRVAERKKAETFSELAGDEGRYLFGRFATPCPGARWAVEGSPVPVVTRSSGESEAQAAIAAFHALPQYRALEKEFASYHADKKATPWETYDGEVAVDVFRGEKGAPLLVVGARGGSGCGDFWGALTAVFDVGAPAQPAIRGVVDASPSVPHLLAGVDLDGDGELELVSGPDGESAAYGLIRPGANAKGTYVRDTFFSAPFLDCPC